jgi:hypothetical protein
VAIEGQIATPYIEYERPRHKRGIIGEKLDNARVICTAIIIREHKSRNDARPP